MIRIDRSKSSPRYGTFGRGFEWVKKAVLKEEHRERRENCLETIRNIGAYI